MCLLLTCTHVQEYTRANWIWGYKRVKQSAINLFKPQSREQHSFSSLKMRNGRQRFSQHLSDGRKPREYLAQKILVFLPETVANYKMFPYAAMWTEPRGIILLLLQSNSYFTQIPPIPKGKELQIANAVMETSNSLRTESSILSIRRKEVTAIDTRWVKLGSVQFVPNLKTVATQFRQERATQS